MLRIPEELSQCLLTCLGVQHPPHSLWPPYCNASRSSEEDWHACLGSALEDDNTLCPCSVRAVDSCPSKSSLGTRVIRRVCSTLLCSLPLHHMQSSIDDRQTSTCTQRSRRARPRLQVHLAQPVCVSSGLCRGRREGTVTMSRGFVPLGEIYRVCER